MKAEQQQEILELRDRNLTPKQIARKLGLKQSEVSEILKLKAEATAIAIAQNVELAPVAKCFVNIECFDNFLLYEEDLDDFEEDEDDEDDYRTIGGLGLVLVARTPSFNKYTVCTYLVDFWCLGVKDAMPMRQVNGNKFNDFVESVYEIFPEGYEEISLEQAQNLVFGAVEYAAKLGLSPHPDWEQAKAHLGAWKGESSIQFGYRGKPRYISGPYDDTKKILESLNQTVGLGNYDYIVGL